MREEREDGREGMEIEAREGGKGENEWVGE